MTTAAALTTEQRGDPNYFLVLKYNIIIYVPAPSFLQDSDLVYKHTLSLAEALTGYEFPLKCVDGSTLLVKAREGQIVNAGVCNPPSRHTSQWTLVYIFRSYAPHRVM